MLCFVLSLDGRNTFSSRRRLRPDMISRPQGDLQHTGHVGLDGAYFGDISFLGGKVLFYLSFPVPLFLNALKVCVYCIHDLTISSESISAIQPAASPSGYSVQAARGCRL